MPVSFTALVTTALVDMVRQELASLGESLAANTSSSTPIRLPVTVKTAAGVRSVVTRVVGVTSTRSPNEISWIVPATDLAWLANRNGGRYLSATESC